ncbi:MAG: hypothetical protein QM744_13435 [Mesorhizobium sp.]
MAEPRAAERVISVGPTAQGSTQQQAASAGIELLLKAESEARRAATVGELQFAIANETMKLARARQIFLLTLGNGKPRVAQVSSISKIDRDLPRLRWIESVVRALGADVGLAKAREFVLPAYCSPDDQEHKDYPFRFMSWIPLLTLRRRPVRWNDHVPRSALDRAGFRSLPPALPRHMRIHGWRSPASERFCRDLKSDGWSPRSQLQR